MKNNKLLILPIFAAAIFVSSCSKHNRFAKGEIYQAEKKLELLSANKMSRDIAQASQQGCAADDPTEDKILSEIKDLENNTNQKGSRSIISGMDLSKFPASQAAYLEKNREWIQSENLNFTDCSDLKCIFSKIYPESDGIEGYYHYYFYLKTGYTLSTVKNVPTVNLEKFKNSDVLFSRNELKGFYYLTKSLSPAFNNLSTLTSIHRMPPLTTIAKYGDSACGLAGGPRDQGWIILMDNCLKRETATTFKGAFYPLATHEIAHRLDHSLLGANKMMSESQEWLDLSGWYIKEDLDPATGKVTKRQWTHSLNTGSKPDGFIRDYAETSPVEDFADSIGHSRYEADKLQQTSPRKYNWIVKNIYGGKSYSGTGLTETFIKLLNEKTIVALTSVINSCVENSTAFTSKASDEIVSQFKEYDQALITCILGGINHSLNNAIAELKANEPEACGYFNANENIIKSRVQTSLSDLIKKDLNKNVEVAQQLKILGGFIQKLNNEVDPREIFISCQEKSAPMDCFNQQMLQSFQNISEEFKDKLPGQLTTLEKNFLSENSYMATKGNITSLFSQIFTGAAIKFQDEAKRKWKMCYENVVTQPTSNEGPTSELLLSPFSGGTQYIKKELLNCLNHNQEILLMEILEKAGKKLSITISNESTKKFILEMYLKEFTSTLQTLVDYGKEKEAFIINEKKTNITHKVVSDLTGYTSWMNKTASESDLKSACQEESQLKIEQALSKNEFPKEDLNFHSSNDNSWNEEICSKVITTQAVKNAFEIKQKGAITTALSSMNNAVLKAAQPTMKKCKTQFSKESTLSVKSRNVCLTNNLTWNSIAESALSEWLDSENYSQSTLARRMGRDYLESKKTELRNLATKKMNSK